MRHWLHRVDTAGDEPALPHYSLTHSLTHEPALPRCPYSPPGIGSVEVRERLLMNHLHYQHRHPLLVLS